MRARNSDMSNVEAKPADRALAYHERTKHQLQRYAAGPETLDWTEQPNPFREYAGSPRVALPLRADEIATRFSALHDALNSVTAQPLTLQSIGQLLELSFALTAWKEYGPDRWALRCNPSSGNLHPTEAYVVCSDVGGLTDGVYHYLSRDHVLEQRCATQPATSANSTPTAWIGLSSIHWREAWKYGERAFRYCQLDVGHAIGALRYAAEVLGWRVVWVRDTTSAQLAQRLGLDRIGDFDRAEHEEPDALFALITNRNEPAGTVALATAPDAHSVWYGRANILDPHPMYRWPVIDDVAHATVDAGVALDVATLATLPTLTHKRDAAAVTLIKQRRSAQRFDPTHVISAEEFYHLLDSVLPRQTAPWDALPFASRIHPVLFVHRVADLAPGLYALPRRSDAKEALQAAMRADFAWTRVEHCPAHLPLFQLATADCTQLARTVHCHQAIAATSCFALGMLAEYEDIIVAQPWRYRQLHWEAGLLGQVLYLEAENLGLRGTGIGCFFDEAFHDLLGLTEKRFQSLYHFTVGRALLDARITTQPPYPQHQAPQQEHTIWSPPI